MELKGREDVRALMAECYAKHAAIDGRTKPKGSPNRLAVVASYGALEFDV